MQFHFDSTQLTNFEKNIRKEWVLTNGLGSYAGGSITGACNRTHQGYLIASLHPPVERYLVFTKTNERLLQDGVLFDLETSLHKGNSCKQGQKYLLSFDYNGTVCFVYQAGQMTLKKTITLVQKKNQVAVAYEIDNPGEEATLTITPLMNFREHSENSTKETLNFSTVEKKHGFTLTPAAMPQVHIQLACSDGTLSLRHEVYDLDMMLQTEVDNEVDGLDSHYCPYDIEITIPSHSTKKVSLLCQTVTADTSSSIGDFTVSEMDAFSAVDKQLAYVDGLIHTAGYKDEFAQALVVASDQFLADRHSMGLKTVLAGLPWFTDWGRDTMIAFTGLTLCTKRYQEAQDILKTFSMYVKNGMVPNMFPDNGQEPLYNTVDASLWYFYAVYKYLSYNPTDEAYKFVQTDIYPYLKEIIAAYKKGTDFSIYMEDDGLIHAGSGLDQVTWMDVRVGEWVVTPRHGKPVEINALWYNALCVMKELALHYKEDAKEYQTLAQKVKDSFCKEFWNVKENCLYDVVDQDEKDASIRPNQIYAVSLPFTMLSAAQALAVVNVVQDKLYAQCGLRSLSPDSKDYHPIYLGALAKRDAAYHQGTAWGFLMGGFITAYMKVHGRNHHTACEALALLHPVQTHLATENCIGSICEIFDGDAPHNGRGCYAQAWSVGEVLRCYVEDILPFL